MTRISLVGIVMIFALVLCRPAFAGNIILTGHDPDFHCNFETPAGTHQCNLFKVTFNLARAGAPDQTKPVLFLDQGQVTCSDGCTHSATFETALAAGLAGIPSTSYVVRDPTSSDFATTNATCTNTNPSSGCISLTTTNYSAILIASDFTCGGCDNDPTGEAVINNRAADIQSFFNAGGGLVYLAGADNSATYYNSVPSPFAPPVVSAFAFQRPAGGDTLTSSGTALGLTNDDANCCFTHNSFSPLPSGTTLQVAETDINSNPETLFATSGNQQPPSGSSSTAVLTFPAGTNVSNQAIFNSTDTDTTQKHSMKLTFANVNTTFTLAVTATEVPTPTPTGVCNLDSSENANSGTPPQDCRLANFFGSTLPEYTTYPYLFPTGTASVNVPYCLAYSHGHCVDLFVQVLSPSNTRPWSGGIQFYVASNSNADALFATTPSGYMNSPQLYDDPDNDQDAADYPTVPGFPYPDSNEDLQYVFNITTYFNPNGIAGQDWGTGGGGKTPNHFVVAFPLAPSTAYTYRWVSPLSSSRTASFKLGTTIPVKFTLSPNTPPGIAVQPPNHVGIAVVSTTTTAGCTNISGTRQFLAFPGGSPTSFTYDSTKLQYQLNLKEIYPVGTTYNILVNSNLFAQQCATFTVTK